MARPSSGEREGSGSEEGRETQGQAVTQYFSCQGRGSLTALLRQVPERVVFCWERRQRSAVKTHTHTDTHTDTNTHMHTYTHTCACTHRETHNTYTHTHMHIHAHTCAHTQHIHMYTHAHTLTHTHVWWWIVPLTEGWLDTAAPNLLAPGTSFMQDSFSADSWGACLGDDSSTLHLLCTLFPRYCISSTSDPQCGKINKMAPARLSCRTLSCSLTSCL